MLRAGGYFVWAAQPVYKHEPLLEEQWEEMVNLTTRLCWKLVKKEGYVAIWQKPMNNSCYLSREKGTQPPLCGPEDDRDKVWYVDLKPCISRLPEEGYGSNVTKWPARLQSIPDRLQSIKYDAYLSRRELYKAESKYWNDIIEGYVNIFRWKDHNLRNVLDMRAGFGGFAEALIWNNVDCWVLNVVPVSGPNTLPVIYDRGLIGVMHDWYSYQSFVALFFTLRISTALVDMYSKCGSLEDARTVFDRIRFKDVVAWNSMIVGYAMNGFSNEALELFKHMCSLSIQPTDITFVGLLHACAHTGLVSEGWSFSNSMTNEFGMDPKVEHYGCMVNLLGRPGKLEEAYQLVKEVSIDRDPVLLGTLLGACRLHKNKDLAEGILKYLIQHNLANSGTYILLSNIYAETGDWDGLAKVRVMMKERGVHKEPGCSSIEVNNKVHEFLAGDMKHPNSKEIYAMLEEING